MDVETADYIRELLAFPQARLVLRVDRQLRSPDGVIKLQETRYFISNLDPDAVTAQELLAYVRGHWQVENSLHFIKDRWWDEDRHYTKRPGLADALVSLTNAALTLLRLSERFEPALPIRGRADQLASLPAKALLVLEAPPTPNSDPLPAEPSTPG